MDTAYVGNIGEESVKEELIKLKGSKISGFIRSKNIVYYGKNFQIDFLVFVPKIGLVVFEVKKWQGTVKATCDDKWIQEYGKYKNEFANASMQVLRTCGLLLQILEKGKINKWPIKPVVIFTHESAKILRAKGNKSPQTDIILKTMISSWIDQNSSDEIFYKFLKSEFEKVKNVICQYTSEYVEN
jgi:hypothetical protein